MLEQTAEILGISSIKYFDLKQNRINDYVFDWNRMLDREGDTGVYLLYQYVRMCNIIEKSQVSHRALSHFHRIFHRLLGLLSDL